MYALRPNAFEHLSRYTKTRETENARAVYRQVKFVVIVGVTDHRNLLSRLGSGRLESKQRELTGMCSINDRSLSRKLSMPIVLTHNVGCAVQFS
jgi:hypothetical protein